MSDENDLDSLSTRQLHDRAVRHALHHGDIKFLWELARAVPAAEAASGDLPAAEDDIQKVSSFVSDVLDSGEGPVGDALRPMFVDYLRKHHG